MLKTLCISAVLLVSGSVVADDQVTKRVAGLDLSQGNSLQMQLCSLKPGKKMKEYEANLVRILLGPKSKVLKHLLCVLHLCTSRNQIIKTVTNG